VWRQSAPIGFPTIILAQSAWRPTTHVIEITALGARLGRQFNLDDQLNMVSLPASKTWPKVVRKPTVEARGDFASKLYKLLIFRGF